MEMIPYLQLIAGLVLLLFGGDYLVRGASSIARSLRVPPLIIGMTIVAFGTSSPEFLVSMRAALIGNPEIALGNVIGSNSVNIGFILAVTALLVPIMVNPLTLKRDWPMMVLASFLFYFASLDGIVTRLEGGIGFLLLILFIIYSINQGRKRPIEEVSSEKILPWWQSILYIVGACIVLGFGADFMVKGASHVATSLGISQRLIGITIVALGTSLPELVTSVVAAFKKEMDISIGNIIGSNIFNILCVIGLTAIIEPIPVDIKAFSVDYYWMILFAILLFPMIFPFGKWYKHSRQGLEPRNGYWASACLGRISGVILLLLYVFYIYLII